jgi:hypothetical protein
LGNHVTLLKLPLSGGPGVLRHYLANEACDEKHHDGLSRVATTLDSGLQHNRSCIVHGYMQPAETGIEDMTSC